MDRRLLDLYLKVYMREFVSKPQPCNDGLDLYTLNRLLDEERITEVYFICTQHCQGLANFTKPLFFLEARVLVEMDHQAKPMNMNNRWSKALSQHLGWLYNKTDKEHVDALDLDAKSRLIPESNRLHKAMLLGWKRVDTPSLSGTYLHEVNSKQMFEVVSNRLLKIPSEFEVFTSGRIVHKRLPFISSTPDCIVGLNEEKTRRVMCPRTRITVFPLGEEESEPVKAFRRLYAPKAVMELKTFHTHAVSSEYIQDIKAAINTGDESCIEAKLESVLERLFQSNRKMAHYDHVRNQPTIFLKQTHFVTTKKMRNTMTTRGCRYPIQNIPFMNLGNPDKYDTNLGVPVEHLCCDPNNLGPAIMMVYDVDSPDNQMIYCHRWMRTPVVLTPQSQYAMQMLEQFIVVADSNSACTAVFIGMFKAYKVQSTSRSIADDHLSHNRYGIGIAFTVNFPLEMRLAMERGMVDQLYKQVFTEYVSEESIKRKQNEYCINKDLVDKHRQSEQSSVMLIPEDTMDTGPTVCDVWGEDDCSVSDTECLEMCDIAIDRELESQYYTLSKSNPASYFGDAGDPAGLLSTNNEIMENAWRNIEEIRL